MKTLQDPNAPADAVEQIVAKWRQAGDRGDAEALAALGYCYANGKGVSKDDAEARKFFEQAADKGSIVGKANLGLFLIQGRGGDKDISRGILLLESSAEAGSSESYVFLGEVYYFGLQNHGTPDYSKAYDHLIHPAEAGHPAAQNMIGVMFKDGLTGKIDLDAARVWLEKAALNGNGKACFNLSELWNPNSENRWARIESIRWLIVGDKMGEIAATYLFEDIKKSVPADELAVATDLAETTFRRLPVAK
jgi:hypothetical protein